MRIGIDIDDTITDSWEYVIPYYSRLFNIPEDILHKSMPYYESIKDKVKSVDEYYRILKPIYDEVTPKVNLLPNVKETIDKLYALGHSIIFITARGIDHTNPYLDSKKYLDKHHIKYDKIIVDSKNKANVCQKEKIDLFIDDSYKHCKAVSELGIPVLMHEKYYNKNNSEFIHFSDWNSVYEYIKTRWDNGE